MKTVWRVVRVVDLPIPPDDPYSHVNERPHVPLAPVCAFVVRSMRSLGARPPGGLRAVEREFERLVQQEDFGGPVYREAWLELLPGTPHDEELLRHVASSLVDEPIKVHPRGSTQAYGNGTHRVLAMRAQEVPETVVLDIVPRDARPDGVLDLSTEYE